MANAHDVQKHEPHEPLGRYLLIYVCILDSGGRAQFFIAFTHIDAEAMFARMLFVAIAEAILALLFFMHLWAEKRGFLLFVVVFTGFVILVMQFGYRQSSNGSWRTLLAV